MTSKTEYIIKLNQKELTDLIDLLYNGILKKITENFVDIDETNLLFEFTDIVNNTTYFYQVIEKEMEEQELNNSGECDFGMIKN